eukprot:gene57534-biopygen39777
MTSGQLCTPKCDQGYNSTKKLSLVCDGAFGEFDGRDANCDPNPCTGGPLGFSEDHSATYFNCNALHTGAICNPVCLEGHTLSAPLSMTCLALPFGDGSVFVYDANASNASITSGRSSSCVANACYGGPTHDHAAGGARCVHNKARERYRGRVMNGVGVLPRPLLARSALRGALRGRAAEGAANACDGGPSDDPIPATKDVIVNADCKGAPR